MQKEIYVFFFMNPNNTLINGYKVDSVKDFYLI